MNIQINALYKKFKKKWQRIFVQIYENVQIFLPHWSSQLKTTQENSRKLDTIQYNLRQLVTICDKSRHLETTQDKSRQLKTLEST